VRVAVLSVSNMRWINATHRLLALTVAILWRGHIRLAGFRLRVLVGVKMRDRGEAVRAHYRAEGATAERERIIALLEANLFSDKGLGNTRLSDLIALIKGYDK
jgi:hypothetical protein